MKTALCLVVVIAALAYAAEEKLKDTAAPPENEQDHPLLEVNVKIPKIVTDVIDKVLYRGNIYKNLNSGRSKRFLHSSLKLITTLSKPVTESRKTVKLLKDNMDKAKKNDQNTVQTANEREKLKHFVDNWNEIRKGLDHLLDITLSKLFVGYKIIKNNILNYLEDLKDKHSGDVTDFLRKLKQKVDDIVVKISQEAKTDSSKLKPAMDDFINIVINMCGFTLDDIEQANGSAAENSAEETSHESQTNASEGDGDGTHVEETVETKNSAETKDSEESSESTQTAEKERIVVSSTEAAGNEATS